MSWSYLEGLERLLIEIDNEWLSRSVDGCTNIERNVDIEGYVDIEVYNVELCNDIELFYVASGKEIVFWATNTFLNPFLLDLDLCYRIV